MTDNEVTDEVRDPAALLASYNKLKADIAELATERDGLKKQLESLNSDEFRLKALGAEAKLALASQGIKDERAFKLVGTDGLDFAEDGSVTGLKERLAELTKEWPEIFDAKVRAGGKADIHANDNADIRRDPLREAVHKAVGR